MLVVNHWLCPECGRIASVADWIARPLCAHSWLMEGTPEVWDGNNCGGREGEPIELAPNQEYRVPGPKTWTAMVQIILPQEGQ